MAMGLQGGYELRDFPAAAGLGAVNFNQAANTVLVSFYLLAGGYVRRLIAVAEAAQGLLAASVLKLSYSTDGGATYTDVVGGTMTPGTRARGVPVYRNFDVSGAKIPAGALVAVRVSTDAGAVSTGRLIVEVQPEPTQPVLLTAGTVAVTS